MKKKLRIYMAVGFLLGMAIGNAIAWFTGPKGVPASPMLIARVGPTGAVLLQSLLSGVYGSLCMGGVLLYEIESWPLAKSTLVHYLLIALPYPVLAKLLGWSRGAAETFAVLLIQLAAFSLIWLIMYLRCRAQVRELNELQKQLDAKREYPQQKEQEGTQ